ncbi:hypothetical protein N9W79_01480 [bacterium]|nr:hypothetical protein [bacterium]
MPSAFQNFNELAAILTKTIQQELIDGVPKTIGILGLQGAGKSTLSTCLVEALNNFPKQKPGLIASTVSLDDFYLPHKNLKLLETSFEFLEGRGIPGTHDIKAMDSFMEAHKNGLNTVKPVYDKKLNHGKGDRVGTVDHPALPVLIFEGWFLGVEPEDLERSSSDMCNFVDKRLPEYKKTWDSVDLWVFLGVSIEHSRSWRKKAEKEHESDLGSVGAVDVDQFLSYMWSAVPPISLVETSNRLSKRHKKAVISVSLNEDHSGNVTYLE